MRFREDRFQDKMMGDFYARFFADAVLIIG